MPPIESKGGLLILAYWFPPQNTSGAVRPFRFYKYLPQFGYTPYVVCGGDQPTAQSQHRVHQVEQARRFSIAGGATFMAKVVQRLTSRYGYRLPWVPLAVSKAAAVIARHGARAVFSTYPPIATHLAALGLKRRYDLKWIADFRDPFCLGTPPFYEPLIERSIMQNADIIIVNTDTAAERLSSRYPQWRNKIIPLYNGFDPAEPVTASPLPRREFKVLAHVGEIYGPRNPAILLASIERLLDAGRLRPEELRIRLIGPLEADCPIHREPSFARLMKRGIVECNGRLVPKEEARRAIAESDYLLLLDTTASGCLPAKIFDYIRVGRPILALTQKDSDAEKILAGSGIPHSCIYKDQTNAEEIDCKLCAFLRLSAEPLRANEWFWERFNAVCQSEHLARILDGLIHAA